MKNYTFEINGKTFSATSALMVAKQSNKINDQDFINVVAALKEGQDLLMDGIFVSRLTDTQL